MRQKTIAASEVFWLWVFRSGVRHITYYTLIWMHLHLAQQVYFWNMVVIKYWEKKSREQAQEMQVVLIVGVNTEICILFLTIGSSRVVLSSQLNWETDRFSRHLRYTSKASLSSTTVIYRWTFTDTAIPPDHGVLPVRFMHSMNSDSLIKPFCS